jgi:aryl-alcohol dehydrogenase-like predicted oxidoreductase
MKEMTSLPTTVLGRTGMQITRVGFGAWAIGGAGWAFAWGAQDDGQSLAAMRYAIDRGVNWIDTAAVYGLGHSEELVGTLLRQLPSDARPYVFTKCGLIWDEQNRTAVAKRIGARHSIRGEIERSLVRLGVERIDLYQVHWPAVDGTPIEDYWQTLLEL